MNGWFVWFTYIWLVCVVYLHLVGYQSGFSKTPRFMSSVFRSFGSFNFRFGFPGSEPTPGGDLDVQWRSGMCGQGIPGSNEGMGGCYGQSHAGKLRKRWLREGLRICGVFFAKPLKTR